MNSQSINRVERAYLKQSNNQSDVHTWQTTCFPSNAPMQFMKCQNRSKSTAIFVNVSSVGVGRYVGGRFLYMTSQVSWTIQQTVDFPERKLAATVEYESPVANNLKHT